MIQIDSIEVWYFRSIFNIKLRNLKDLSVFSGKNDSGKSNILKALNLFFNNETDWHKPFNFSSDFSHKRLEKARASIKGRQFVRVAVTFRRGERSEKSLPENFTVTRTWYRDSSVPETKTSIARQFKQGKTHAQSLDRAEASVQRYLNTVKYEYVPAVKDKSFFAYSLGLLSDSVFKKHYEKTNTINLIKDLNEAVRSETSYIKDEFKAVCGVETDIQLPADRAELFRAFKVATNAGKNKVPLEMRGDGIQARFLPSLFHHVATNSKYYYVWGFEEPENCLEYLMASSLAKGFCDVYSTSVQCFITSHSPAFINLEGNKLNMYRVYFSDETKVVALSSLSDRSRDSESLRDELGFVELYRKHQDEIDKKRLEVEGKNRLLEEIKSKTGPVLLTEGKSDVGILEEAWKKLYPRKTRLFAVVSCDPCPEIEGGAGGAQMLAKALESCRVGLPQTVGLFDRDDEGIKNYNDLDGNFIEKCSNGVTFKQHKNNHVAAILLPAVVIGKEKFIQKKNFPIEYMFPEVYVTQRKDDKGLEFEQEWRTTLVGGKKETNERTVEPEHRKVKSGKVYYAEKVVPTFPEEAFANFKILFKNIGEMFKLIEGKKV
ncbi:MAG TPA: hypothetical protein DEA99_03335 [Candidatus Omnitrophica bacterium]|nr:hypothetical protein [Candidatus Omnitrophota bacterium]